MERREKMLTRSPRTAYRIVDGEAVIVLPEEGTAHILNETGARIWELADGSKNISEIAEIICREFDVPLETALRDINEFMEKLVEKKMLSHG